MKSLIRNLSMLMFLGGLPAVFVARFGCRDADEPCLTCPPPYVQTIFLDTVYTEPTEIGVRVTMADSLATSIVQIFRDTTEIFSKRVLAADTMIIDDSLLPARTYRYIAYRQTNGQRIDSSNVFTVRTMDTTSHEFRWEIDTLGDGNSSVLYDVAIVNDTLAYAVGEIYKRDSTGQFAYPPYGMAIWNGKDWKLEKLFYVHASGDTLALANIRGIFYISSSEIWLAAGSIFRWDGVSSVTELSLSRLSLPNPTATIEKIWGTSSTNLYGVGNAGTIVHYENGSWRRLESGTDVNIHDIWGVVEQGTTAPSILAVGSYTFIRGNKAIFKIRNQTVVDTITWISDRIPHSIWFASPTRLFVCGEGVYKGTQQGGWWRYEELPQIFMERIRGQSTNDVFVVGDFGIVGHFNGVTWRVFPEVAVALYYSCSYKNNLVVAVGERNARAIVLRMHR